MISRDMPVRQGQKLWRLVQRQRVGGGVTTDDHRTVQRYGVFVRSAQPAELRTPGLPERSRHEVVTNEAPRPVWGVRVQTAAILGG